MNALKTLLGLIVLGLLAWLLAALFAGPAVEEVETREFTSSQQCRECHPQVFAEWESSWHARAWIDEDVRALSNDFANTDCIDCHAPRPVFETGVGKRVLPRASRRGEGVDCISCHQLPGGGVAGTIDKPSAACRPAATLDLARADFCGVCHDQHQTVQQWKATPFAEAGTGCIDCHMPFRDGDPDLGRDHRCLGGHDEALVRSAVELRGRRAGEGWVVEVENVAAGHHFPTDERSRAADVFWRPLAPGAQEGAGDWRFLHRIRDPYRHEVDLESTLVAFGEVRAIPLEDPESAEGAEVALFYRLTPYYTDPETGTPVHESTVRDPRPGSLLVHRIVLRP